MQRLTETLAGDTPGQTYALTVLRFGDRRPDRPSAYLQAALHGNELPGVAALHRLIPRLAAAEAEGRLTGSVTIVPFANPIGLGQYVWGEQQGRFSFASRVNFNRDIPLIDRPDPALIDAAGALSAEKRLKARLLALSIGHDIVLDLHCDDESLSYFYAPAPLWPQMADLAACLGSAAVLTFDGGTDASFDEASFHPYRSGAAGLLSPATRAIATVEFRGLADVSAALAERDGDGLYRFLAGRGVIADDRFAPPPPFAGPAVPQTYVEMVRAPVAGMVFFNVGPGDRVAAGDVVATVIGEPGTPGADVAVQAPAAGLVLTRRSHRMTRAGDDLMKIVGDSRSASAKTGALED